MEYIFALLFFISFIMLLVGFVSPKSSLFWISGNKSRLKSFVYYSLILLFTILGVGISVSSNERNKEVQNEDYVSSIHITDTSYSAVNTSSTSDDRKERTKRPTKIEYVVLRAWNPNKDKYAIGLEILVEDSILSISKVTRLIKQITWQQQRTAIIRIYTSRAAWNESQTDNYTDEYKQHYVAFYVQNPYSQGAYAGANEIRWMQERGKLSHLYGSTTQLHFK